MYMSKWHSSIKQVVCRRPIGGIKRTYSWHSDSGSPAADVVLHRQPQVAHSEPGIRLSSRQWWTGWFTVWNREKQDQVWFVLRDESALMAAQDEGRHPKVWLRRRIVVQGQGLRVALCGANLSPRQGKGPLRKGPTRPVGSRPNRGTWSVCSLDSYKTA
jgi:hypothetical protein